VTICASKKSSVNPRHAVALALVGWYLMVPPVESCTGAFSGGACHPVPLEKWQIVGTYDSPSGCEKVKKLWIQKGRMYLADMEASSRSRTTRMSLDEASATTDMAATCITRADPRLKEN
jgi:hypothetical protein